MYVQWPKGREGGVWKSLLQWTRNSYCICTQNPSGKTSVNAVGLFLKASMGHCTPWKNWKKRKKEEEENHWRKHTPAAGFLRCAEIASFGLTPTFPMLPTHALHDLVSTSFWIRRDFLSCFKMLSLKWRNTSLDRHHLGYPSGQCGIAYEKRSSWRGLLFGGEDQVSSPLSTRV